jgi:hypothetical protein
MQQGSEDDKLELPCAQSVMHQPVVSHGRAYNNVRFSDRIPSLNNTFDQTHVQDTQQHAQQAQTRHKLPRGHSTR